MEAQFFDVAVVGVGGMGSAALYHLARQGLRVCGIEQFLPAHANGSSHGDTRIIRKAYFEHPAYVPLLQRTYELWRELEETSKASLMHQCGFLTLGGREASVLKNLASCYQEYSLPHENWTTAEIVARFPQFRIAEEMFAFFDPSGGYLRVEACVDAHVRMAVHAGARLFAGERLLEWHTDGDGVRLKTEQREIFASKVIFTTGPWTSLPSLGIALKLELSRRVVFWYNSADPQRYFPDHFPSFYMEEGRCGYYGCPAVNGFGVKVGEHLIPQKIELPEEKDKPITASEETTVLQFIAKTFPDLAPEPTRRGTCIYTMSPDHHFIIDRHPEQENVFIAAGFSGHGFKFAPVVGEVLAELVIDGETRQPIDFLRLKRFSEKMLE